MRILSDQLVIVDERAFNEQFELFEGMNPYNRPIEDHIKYGFVVLDKPAGPTSHEIVATVKRVLDLKKAGHSGTLDPQVTGILPIALEGATKVLQTLLQLPKTYVCNMKLQESFSGDWNEVLQRFTGRIYQYPPLESNVARRLRKRKIYEITILDEKEKFLLFEVRCQSGTYIRTLCLDIGKAIGIPAVMYELRRVQTALFDESNAVTLHMLFDSYMNYKEMGKEDALRTIIRPLEEAVLHLKQIVVNSDAIRSVTHGVMLGGSGVLAYDRDIGNEEVVAAFTRSGELIGIGKSLIAFSEFSVDNKAVFQVEKVILPRSKYVFD